MKNQQILKPENIRIFFDSKEEPAAYADDGETVVFCCMDCYGKRITGDGMDYSKLAMPEGNPVTGPLYIRGAEPGDVLEIEILDIAVDCFGSMCGTGLAPMKLREATAVSSLLKAEVWLLTRIFKSNSAL